MSISPRKLVNQMSKFQFPRTLSVQDRVSGLVMEAERITIMSMIMIMRMTPILAMHGHVLWPVLGCGGLLACAVKNAFWQALSEAVAHLRRPGGTKQAQRDRAS